MAPWSKLWWCKILLLSNHVQTTRLKLALSTVISGPPDFNRTTSPTLKSSYSLYVLLTVLVSILFLLFFQFFYSDSKFSDFGVTLPHPFTLRRVLAVSAIGYSLGHTLNRGQLLRCPHNKSRALGFSVFGLSEASTKQGETDIGFACLCFYVLGQFARVIEVMFLGPLLSFDSKCPSALGC
jgi:hypothetical protein